MLFGLFAPLVTRLMLAAPRRVHRRPGRPRHAARAAGRVQRRLQGQLLARRAGDFPGHRRRHPVFNIGAPFWALIAGTLVSLCWSGRIGAATPMPSLTRTHPGTRERPARAASRAAGAPEGRKSGRFVSRAFRAAPDGPDDLTLPAHRLRSKRLCPVSIRTWPWRSARPKAAGQVRHRVKLRRIRAPLTALRGSGGRPAEDWRTAALGSRLRTGPCWAPFDFQGTPMTHTRPPSPLPQISWRPYPRGANPLHRRSSNGHEHASHAGHVIGACAAAFHHAGHARACRGIQSRAVAQRVVVLSQRPVIPAHCRTYPVTMTARRSRRWGSPAALFA